MFMRWWTNTGILPILSLLVATGSLAALAEEPIAVLTEIRVGQGEVRVKLAAEADWTAPLPLLSLRSGDQIRATQNAAAVLMFAAGQGTVTVSAANSPYEVQAPIMTSSSPTWDLLKSLGRLLMGQKKELVHVPLASRKVQQRLLLMAPRDGTLLGEPTFEWVGSDQLRYTVRISGPEGALWAQTNLPRAPLAYPTTAPRLRPGVLYRWELEAMDLPTQQGQFTILPEAEVVEVRKALASLGSLAQADYPRNTVILLRAAYLFERGLFTETRAELQAALAADPDAPSLHVMLGRIYERTSLPDLALSEFDEAQFLSAGGH